MIKNYEVVKFIDDELEIDVRTDKENETVWLSTEQIAILFGRDYKTIRKHINNALKELSKLSVDKLREERYSKFRAMGRFIEG